MQTPTMTKVKKVVGAAGVAITTLAAWMLANHATLLSLAPKYAANIEFATTLVGVIASLWGKHPWASPSVTD